MSEQWKHWRAVPNEELKVGDVVRVLGPKRIMAIRPYTGPLIDIIFALADTDLGPGFSLERGGYTDRFEQVVASESSKP